MNLDPTFLSLSLIILISYLIGSISGGVIIGKIKNTDIRKIGSKSAGATNAFRTMGFIFALIVVLIDISKGYFAVEYIPAFFLNENIYNINQIKILTAFSSILGHCYPIFFKFKGGKGVGTALGTLLAIFPLLYSLIAFGTWFIILILSGYVGLSSIIAGLSISIIHNILKYNINDPFLQLFGILIGLFFIFTHTDNIKRLLKREENQFKKIMLFKSFKK